MIFSGLFSQFSPFKKLLLFCLLALASLMTFMLLAAISASLIWKISFDEIFVIIGNYDHPEAIGLLRYFQIINQLGLFIFPSLLFAFLANKHAMRYLHLNVGARLLTFLLCSLILFSSLPLIHWMLEINQELRFPSWLHQLEEWMRYSEDHAEKLTLLFLETQTTGGLIVNIFMIALLPAVGEEMVFRGVLQRLFGEWFKNHHIAILISAIVFSSLHMQFYGFLPRTALGVIFGYLFFATSSLWVPILVHFVNNVAVVLVAFFYRSGSLETDYMEFGRASNAGWVVGSFVLVILLFFSLNQYLKQHSSRSGGSESQM